MNTGLFSSKTCEWSTPQEIYDKLNREFHFTLDPCATPDNAKCEHYYTIEDNGLSYSWRGERVFCNPPYGREIGKWVKKAAESQTLTVMLIPARTDTSYFHDYIYRKAEIRFLRGRLRFGDGNNNAPFPSMIVIFDNNPGSKP